MSPPGARMVWAALRSGLGGGGVAIAVVLGADLFAGRWLRTWYIRANEPAAIFYFVDVNIWIIVAVTIGTGTVTALRNRSGGLLAAALAGVASAGVAAPGAALAAMVTVLGTGRTAHGYSFGRFLTLHDVIAGSALSATVFLGTPVFVIAAALARRGTSDSDESEAVPPGRYTVTAALALTCVVLLDVVLDRT